MGLGTLRPAPFQPPPGGYFFALKHTLTSHDLTSQTWSRFTKALSTELERLRESNDGQHDVIETAAIRGRIAAIKDLLALGKTSAAAPAGPDQYPVERIVELHELGIETH